MGNQESVGLQSREVTKSGDPLSIVTICLDPEAAKDLQQFVESTPLVQLRGELKNYLDEDDSLLEWLQERSPDICLVDFDQDRRNATLTAERIHERLQTTAIVAISANTRSDLIIEAMRCGCSEYLVKPTEREQFLEAVARVGGRKKEKREQYNGELLTFLGAKGGCGVTTLATHLGAFLAKTCSRKTVLIDLHPANGDCALYLGFTKHPYHFYELAESNERLDFELLQSFVLHHSSGLDLLPAPLTEAARNVGPEAIGRAIEFIRLRYEFVLIDCPPGLTEQNCELVRRSDHVYLVTVAEVPALRNLTRYLEYLTRMEFSQEKVRVVLNRYLKRGAISDDEIEKAIRQRIYWRVPNQYNQVIRDINAGDPLSGIGSDVSRSLLDWAGDVSRKPADGEGNGKRKSSRGLLGLLGG
ncbi:MAG TPA: response regulator [Terriglobia bacterium]|jgi:pilus assembly protein CpaE|nr:response regulator [Terriglobia bacterium]